MQTTLRIALLGATAALSCVACTPPPLPARTPPPDACPAPWPSFKSTRPDSGKISVTIKNQMGGTFGIRRVLVGLDDVPICWRTAPGNGLYLDESSLPVLSGPLPEGEYSLKVVVNADGVEAYQPSLQGYRFEIRSFHPIVMTAGKSIEVTVIVDERAGGPPEERPFIRYVHVEHETPR